MLVVVYDPTSEPTVWPAKWNEESEMFESANSGEATHWMRLPDAPKSHAWSDGYVAADYDDKNPEDFTHNPHQPTSPYTYPEAYAGPPTFKAVEWDAGYHYRMFAHQRCIIQLKITHKIGNQTIEMYM